ncbi:MAG: YncE family protein [Pyrinomonadaceae bacterium]
MKIRTIDGAVIGTYPTGSYPRIATFDGANIWIANELSGTVTKLRSSDGTLLGNFATGSRAFGAAFDGANVWVMNYGSGTISKK